MDRFDKAIEMAEGYLLSDLTFRECWEFQRQGLLGIPEVVCKAFPTGLVVEMLCANGHDLSTQVNDIFCLLSNNGFRYYENYLIAPDIDEIGLLLRLYRYSAHKAVHREMLQRPLNWLKHNILPSGEILAYWTEGIDVSVVSPEDFVTWGASCVGIEMHMLLGLMAYDWETYHPMIEKSALRLLTRFVEHGVSGITNYEILYVLWVSFKLINQLSVHSISEVLAEKISQVHPVLVARLTQEIKQQEVSPQSAAFLTLTCLGCGVELLFNQQWIARLLKQQRYDGSWDDEPFFPTPNRTLITWYSSRTLTTAFCYHALRTYQQWEAVC